MDMFYAIAEPRRREIIEILSINGRMTATEIYKRFDITAQAISQHLKVLLDARLVIMEKESQRHIYRINQESILEINKWLIRMENNVNESLDRLDILLKNKNPKPKKDYN